MEEFERNSHYSEKTGHAARGAHAKVERILGRNPEGVPGFIELTVSKRRETRAMMRRTPRDGKR